jgi:chromosome segregation ATPase
MRSTEAKVDKNDRFMGSMEMKVDKLEAQLKQWGEKLEDLEAQAKEAGSEAKGDFHQRIVDLKAKYEIAQKKLAEFKTMSRGKWNNFKADLETLWKDIEVTFRGLTHK